MPPTAPPVTPAATPAGAPNWWGGKPTSSKGAPQRPTLPQDTALPGGGSLTAPVPTGPVPQPSPGAGGGGGGPIDTGSPDASAAAAAAAPTSSGPFGLPWVVVLGGGAVLAFLLLRRPSQ
jgi:hypothetical protein